MKYLGIDFGTKRIGLAVSDEDGILAFPKKVILNNALKFENIQDIIQKEKIEALVVGEPLNHLGKLNKVSGPIFSFIKDLKKKFNLPLYQQKEFFTSVEAGKNLRKTKKTETHTREKKKIIPKADDSAAALILQRYLDKRNKEEIEKN